MPILTYIYLATVFVAFLSSLMSFRLNLPVHLKFFSALLGLTFLVELFASVILRFVLGVKNNHWVYNAFMLVEFPAYGYYFYRIIRIESLKKAIRFFLIVFPVFWIITVLFQIGIRNWNSYVITVGSFFTVLFALMYYYQLMSASEMVTLRMLPEFWIATGMVIFYLTALPYFGMLNFLIRNYSTLATSLLGVVKVMNILMYSFFTIGFLCSILKATKS
jgi:hypothetical protein